MTSQARLLEPDSADLTLLQDRQVAVLGFGPVASGHALNLRDSGVDVRVGVPAESRAAARAEVEGLLVVSPQDAVRQADIVVLPTDDSTDQATLQQLLTAGLEPGDMILVTGPEPVHSQEVTAPDGVDLVVLQGIGGPDRLRGEYLDGRGVPCLVAVETDATSVAWPVLTAYSQALGSLRSGALVTSAAELAEAGSYAEEAVHLAVQRLVEDGFDRLVERGTSEEVAYLLTLHELKQRIDTAWTAGFGTEQVPDRHAAELESRRAVARAAHPIEQVGRRVRALMSWIR
ncbi:NAD(P)-binding domain-containing protein [Ornithinimicrobium faecis]|uniref:NAD(P)-binding domain-containing protein n=1 Tax=Ornithinimicrobium faecis TaxID=2934158 RepID=UPI00211786FE|nr:NAD(P)-binding domain-containing protein [Ornithinimicrobium sp. HY1745]